MVFADNHEVWSRGGHFDTGLFRRVVDDSPLALACLLRDYGVWYAEQMAPSDEHFERYAAEVFAEGLRCDPESFDTHYAGALVQLNFATTIAPASERGRFLRKARVGFAEALRLRPRSANALYGMGCATYEDSDASVSEAAAWFSQAIDVAPQMSKAQLLRANCAQDVGEWGVALKHYALVDDDELAATLHPWRVTSMVLNRVYCFAKLDRFEEAKALLLEILAQYECASPNDMPDELFDCPDRLIQVAATHFRDSIWERVARCIHRYGWEERYRDELSPL